MENGLTSWASRVEGPCHLGSKGGSLGGEERLESSSLFRNPILKIIPLIRGINQGLFIWDPHKRAIRLDLRSFDSGSLTTSECVLCP